MSMDSTRFQSYQALDQPPTHVLKKMETLKLLECRREDLETQLVATKGEIQRLRQDLAEYQTLQSPIGRIPLEILSRIHEECVADRPIGVGALLLVSKFWYEATIGNPRLWQHIEIALSDKNYENIHFLQSYVKNCLIRSRNLPLRIKVDFTNWKNKEEWLDSTVENFLSGISDIDVNHNFTDDTIPFSLGSWTAKEYPAYKKCTEGCVAMVESLIGEGKSEIGRWEDLEVIFPDNPLPPNLLLRLLGQDAPALRRLSIHNFFGPRRIQISPTLTALEELNTAESHVHLHQFVLNPKSLTSLKFHERSLSFATLSTFKFLQNLKICSSHSMDIFNQPGTILFLPDLKYLTLEARFDKPFATDLQLPSLEHLSLSMTYRVSQCQLPNLTPRSVRWTIRSFYRTCENRWTEKDLEATAPQILSHYTTICSLEVDEFGKNAALKALKQAQADGRCLSMVLVVNDHMSDY